jgi:hypothetical protein
MAEKRAATTSCCVASSGATIPVPTVVATAVPLSAPRKFSTPAMSTARPGERTRVATEVATALAVSWKPLMKSNTTPRRITRTSTAAPPSGIPWAASSSSPASSGARAPRRRGGQACLMWMFCRTLATVAALSVASSSVS